jgi:hypothetical protein
MLRFERAQKSITYVFSTGLHSPIPPAGTILTFLLSRSSHELRSQARARKSATVVKLQ